MTTVEFSSLIQSNYPALLNFAKRLTRNQYDAEDLVQETAIKALKGRHTFKMGTSFLSWAFTILKNTFINKYNKRKRRAVVNNPIEDFTFALENKYTVKNNALSKMRVKELNQAISNLSDNSRVPFIMHYSGYQYNEIAEHLDIPIGTVKSRINFARKKLKQKLDRKG